MTAKTPYGERALAQQRLEGEVEIRIRKADKASILDLKGPLLLGKSAEAFGKSAEKLLDAGTKNLAINLAGVSKMDSSGIGAMVKVFTSTKKLGGNCKFYAPSKNVLQLLKMLRLDRVLDLARDEASALAGF